MFFLQRKHSIIRKDVNGASNGTVKVADIKMTENGVKNGDVVLDVLPPETAVNVEQVWDTNSIGNVCDITICPYSKDQGLLGHGNDRPNAGPRMHVGTVMTLSLSTTANRRFKVTLLYLHFFFKKWDFDITGIWSASSLFIDHLNIDSVVTEKVFSAIMFYWDNDFESDFSPQVETVDIFSNVTFKRRNANSSISRWSHVT